MNTQTTKTTSTWKPSGIFGAIAFGLALIAATEGHATTIVFAPGDYDNTFNVVAECPGNCVTTTNNQTTGSFRDVFWYSTRNPQLVSGGPNGDVAGPGSADFINSGPNLITSGGSPAHAYPGGAYTALNFTGDAPSGGQSYLTIYDKTPGDGALTKNTFDASVPGGLKISADVLFSPGQHTQGGGVVTLYNEGQDGLALLASNMGGNNPDSARLDLVFKAAGPANGGTPVSPLVLATSALPFGTFVGEQWYRVTLGLEVVGDTYNATGTFQAHTTPSNPNSALGAVLGNVLFSGSLSNPDASARVLTNPGEIGIMALTYEGFSDGGCPPSAFPNLAACNDNVGVSVTNFAFPGDPVVPEPSTWLLMSVGLAGLAAWRMKKQAA